MPLRLRDALLLQIASDCLLRVAEASALDVSDIAFEHGWLRVVKKGGYEKAFFGVLVFSRVPETAEAMAKRRWQVTIPEEYFRAALNGGISVVFGPYRYKHYVSVGWDGYELADRGFHGTNWVLWMSDYALW